MSYTRDTWRLILDPPAPGAWNMAVDEAILEAVGRNEALPTLRLYAWHPPCLSLGYNQPANDVDQERLSSLGWEVVRRPTGGRAILHTDELTYAVIAPSYEPRLAGGVLESYQRLAQALLDALHRLGILAKADEKPYLPPNTDIKGPICFEVPSNYEITVDGKKIIGSAQARRREGVLQHGSFPLWGDVTRITQALSFPNEDKRFIAAARLKSRATTAEEILGHRLEWEMAAQAFIAAFESCLNLNLVPAELTLWERARAAALMAEKYANDTWTKRV